MAVRIRLMRIGTKKKPFYRIVAANSQSPRNGKFLEILGTYDPLKDPAEVKVKPEILKKWLEEGVKCSNTVATLLRARKLLPNKNVLVTS